MERFLSTPITRPRMLPFTLLPPSAAVCRARMFNRMRTYVARPCSCLLLLQRVKSRVVPSTMRLVQFVMLSEAQRIRRDLF
jgi:hypothetical protein